MKPASFALLALMLAPWPLRAAGPDDYLSHVKPLLTRHCVSCHGPAKARAGLRLDTAAGLLKGGNTGPAAVAGKSADSLLLKAVIGAEGVAVMPPKGERLSATDVERLRAWIDAGAKAPAAETAAAAGVKATHWSFLAPRRSNLSAPSGHPIDAFLDARLAKEGIAPSPEADRVTLARRLSLDLLGLPPDPADVDAFVQDTRPDAYERLVERLLASPHYGERWGRWWLDLARYADSNGYSIDAPRSMWPYRDWVISSLNADVPFDRFTVEQLAGDLLPGAAASQRVATGFHRNTQINQEGGIDVEQFRVESVVDRVNTTGAVWLGLTLGCCQCHDHKYDPFSQREYYQLFAFLNNADEPSLELGSPEELARRKQARARIDAVRKRLKPLDPTTDAGVDRWEKALTTPLRMLLPKDVQEILEVPENGRTEPQKDRLAEAYRRSDQARHVAAALAGPGPLPVAAHLHLGWLRHDLDREWTALRRSAPPPVTTLVLQERSQPRVTRVLLGGDFTRPGVPVGPGTPAQLPPLRPRGPQPDRLDLARWLTDPANPLTARVLVNRLWQHYFGVGLVETENDFGTQGTPPTHPEMLDWLATELPRQGWSLKSLHRLIVTSAAYKRSSHARPDLAGRDARNRLLARQNRLRLDAEVVRDVTLAASGRLCRTVGGPSVYPPQPDGLYRFTQIDKNWKASTGPDRYRRGLYTFFWRSAPHPSLTVFDAPDATTTCTRRNRSNTPLQALTLLNDAGQYELARALAARTLRDAPPNDAARLDHAFRTALARRPTDRERSRLQEMLNNQRAAGEADAWTSVARVVLNLDEFITRE